MLELSLTTKFIIVALILLAAGLYYVYNSTQKFKTAIVNLLNNMQPEEQTQAQVQQPIQVESEPQSEDKEE